MKILRHEASSLDLDFVQTQPEFPLLVTWYLFRKRASAMKMFRKHYHHPQDKFDLLCRHLEQGEAVSKLCDEVGLCPAVFYEWKQTFFEAGEAALEGNEPDNDKLQLHQQIQVLQQKILRMNEDFAELKKELERYKARLQI